MVDDPGNRPDVLGDRRSELRVGALLVGVVVAVVMLWQGVAMFRPAWQISQGQGVQGTLAIEAVRCGKQCSHFGTFTSSDGHRTITAAHLLHGAGKVGERVPAVYLPVDSPPAEVHARDSNALPASILLLGVGTFAALTCSGILLESGVRSWRRHRVDSASLKHVKNGE